MDQLTRILVTRFAPDLRAGANDDVVVEEPLEIRVEDRPLAVTMRTPGDDFELAAGFLFTENVIRRAEEIESIRHWASPNVVRVELNVPINWTRLQRHFYSTSSCGVCGKASIDAIRVQASPSTEDVTVQRDLIATLPDIARAEQKTFASTGAIHAAALFTTNGDLIALREDIGRHNAVDKVMGARLRGAPVSSPVPPVVLFVSGRAGFEVVQKAAVAQIPIIAAVGAPSSLAVDLAKEMNITLIGFLREGRFNVYSAEGRVRSDTTPAG